MTVYKAEFSYLQTQPTPDFFPGDIVFFVPNHVWIFLTTCHVLNSLNRIVYAHRYSGEYKFIKQQ